MSGTVKKGPPPSTRKVPAGQVPPSGHGRGGDEESSLVGVSMGAMDSSDDPFADDEGPGLDIAIDTKPSPKVAPQHMLAAEQDVDPNAVDPNGAPPKKKDSSPAEILAAYGVAPKQFWNWPFYAVRVMMRQYELRNELQARRTNNAPDVPLYEQAMKAYDANTFARGAVMITLSVMLFVLAILSPVIVRFWKLAMDN